MNDIVNVLKNYPSIRQFIETLPCGVLLVDEDGHVQAVNKVIERVFGMAEHAVLGRGSGDLLGCVNARFLKDGCGTAERCKHCQIKNLALSALERGQKRKAGIAMQLVHDGQVKDLQLFISATPFVVEKNKRFASVIIEDLTSLASTPKITENFGFHDIIGRHHSMCKLFTSIRQSVRIDAPVLIQGESGTGKELTALAIHKERPDPRGLFVPVHCASIPEGLFESELFGHVRGAFTGAIKDKKGRFELANGGTLFFDEISEISQPMQIKLLRVLQDGIVEPVGGTHTIRVKTKVVSATNKDIEREVSEGRFREDLYYRLCVFSISTPPLRARKDDIPLLAEHFLNKYKTERSIEPVQFSNRTIDALMKYPWPGNVRELQNTIQYAIAICYENIISPKHLPPRILLHESRPVKKYQSKLKLHPDNVAEALESARGNKKLAAQLLGVSRTTLYRFFDRQAEATGR